MTSRPMASHFPRSDSLLRVPHLVRHRALINSMFVDRRAVDEGGSHPAGRHHQALAATGYPRAQAFLSASTTVLFIACRAGSQPPSTPITAAKIRACNTTIGVTRKAKAIVEKVRKLPKLVERPLMGKARITPIVPAASASASDSSKNDPSTAPGRKPSARSVPISVVRAATDAYIVFIAANTAPIPMITATTPPSARSWLATTDWSL